VMGKEDHITRIDALHIAAIEDMPPARRRK
jgi:hypothetical protein